MTNGYTTIQINDEVIGLRWGLPARDWLVEKTAEMAEALFDKNNKLTSSGYAHVLYYGYKNECIYSEIKATHSLGYFMDFIDNSVYDEAKNKLIADAINVWTESLHIKKIIETVQANSEKKNLKQAKKLKPTATVV